MRTARAILSEATLVATAGLILALAANALSPRGLRLGRNYFPAIVGASPAAPLPAQATPAASATPPALGLPGVPAAPNAALRRLEQRGLQAAAGNEVSAWFRDPRHEQGLIAFIDARDEAHYQAGHIPGSWQFDHYRAEAYLPAVLPVCMNAQQVVVYCNGGTCEDSEFAAVLLRDAGVPRTSLFVYVGGITEWKSNGLPVETGARRSGQLLQPLAP